MSSARQRSGTTFGARPPLMVPMFSVLGPRIGSVSSGMLRRSVRMSSILSMADSQGADRPNATSGHSFQSPDAVRLRTERQLILGGLAVDEVLRPAQLLRHEVSAGAIALLAHHQQEREIAHPFLQQAFDGEEHACLDAFGVAGAAAPDQFVIFAGREGGNSVDVK